PHRHLKAIGNLAAYWGWLEMCVDSTLWCLLAAEAEQGAAITTHVGILTKIDSIRILAGHKLARRPQRITQLEALLNRFDPLRIKRNNYVHYWWTYSPRRRAADGTRITAKGKLKVTNVKVSAQEIEETAYEVWHLTLDYQRFLQNTFPRYSFV